VARRSGPAVDALVTEKSLFDDDDDDEDGASDPSELAGVAPVEAPAAATLATEALVARA
jgi:hypothetical protein